MTDQKQTMTAILQWIEVSMHQSMQSFFRYAKENNISMSQVGALFHISRQGMSGVTDIGERLGVSSAAASQMLDRLVQQNLLVRTEDPNDRRARQITLTEEGRSLLDESMRARQSWLLKVVESLTPEERGQVSAALECLISKARLIDAGEIKQSSD